MSVEIREGQVVIEGTMSVEEVEGLVAVLDELGSAERARVDMSNCLHMHTAGVQVLRNRHCEVIAWPKVSEWTEWLRAGLHS